MSRQPSCGPAEARARAKVARLYLTVADLVKGETDPRAWANVAVGNAVLAGIAAADAICCTALGRRSRDSDHRLAAELLDMVDKGLGKALRTLLEVKDLAHYGEGLVVASKVSQALRAAERLVTEAEDRLAA